MSAKIKKWYECTKCGTLYDDKEEARSCCGKASTTGDLESLRNRVIEEIARPVFELITYTRTFILPTKVLPDLIVEVDIVPPEVDLKYEATLDDFEFKVRLNVDGADERYYSLAAMIKLVTDTCTPQKKLENAIANLFERDPFGALNTLSAICEDTDDVAQYLYDANKLLSRIQRRCHDSGDAEYKALVIATLENGEEYITSLSADELRSVVEEYDD